MGTRWMEGCLVAPPVGLECRPCAVGRDCGAALGSDFVCDPQKNICVPLSGVTKECVIVSEKFENKENSLPERD